MCHGAPRPRQAPFANDLQSPNRAFASLRGPERGQEMLASPDYSRVRSLQELSFWCAVRRCGLARGPPGGGRSASIFLSSCEVKL
jgi:hypothetical protein